MPTQRAFIFVSRWMRLLLILVGVVGITACSWTDLLNWSVPAERVEIPDVPPALETATPIPEVVEQGPLTGYWVGRALLEDGTQINYELVLTQTGTEVTGTASSTDGNVTATVDVRGTYEDRLLELEESGGQFGEGWEGGVCYWKLHLRMRTRGAAGAIRLVGPFDDVPNSEGTCTGKGEISLTQQ
jgi:hypothetical protein